MVCELIGTSSILNVRLVLIHGAIQHKMCKVFGVVGRGGEQYNSKRAFVQFKIQVRYQSLVAVKRKKNMVCKGCCDWVHASRVILLEKRDGWASLEICGCPIFKNLLLDNHSPTFPFQGRLLKRWLCCSCKRHWKKWIVCRNNIETALTALMDESE